MRAEAPDFVPLSPLVDHLHDVLTGSLPCSQLPGNTSELSLVSVCKSAQLPRGDDDAPLWRQHPCEQLPRLDISLPPIPDAAMDATRREQQLFTRCSEALPPLPSVMSSSISCEICASDDQLLLACMLCVGGGASQHAGAGSHAEHPLESATGVPTDLAALSSQQLAAQVLELRSLLKARDDRIDLLSNMVQDFMEAAGFVDDGDSPIPDRQTAPVSSTVPGSTAAVVSPSGISQRLLEATSLSSLTETLNQYVDEHRGEALLHKDVHRAGIAFFVRLEQILPSRLFHAARDIDPAEFKAKRYRKLADLESHCMGALDIIIGSDSHGDLDTLWPELQDALM